MSTASITRTGASTTPSAPHLYPDLAEIDRALRLLIEPDQVFELRALEVRPKGTFKPLTFSGFFKFEDIKNAVAEAALANNHKPKGIYYTLNSLHEDMLSVKENRLSYAGSGETASDENVIRRRRLLVDADVERKSKVSATDEEKAKAYERIIRVRAYLASLGFPAPLLIDSGNGYHLVYRIDLPAADERLVERFLKALSARFTDDAVKIDTGVANPSRISKLPGTVVRKGNSTPERPWRLAMLLEVPESYLAETVPTEMIERVAAEYKEPAKSKRSRARTDESGASTSDVELAEEALGFLSHDRDYEYLSWLKIGMSLTPLGQDGLRLWNAWSTKGPRYEQGACEEKWDTFKGSGCTLGTLFHLAEERGFKFPPPPLVFVGPTSRGGSTRSSRTEEEARHEQDADADMRRRAGVDPEDEDPAIEIQANETFLEYKTDRSLKALARDNGERPAHFKSGNALVRLRRGDGILPRKELITDDALRGVLARIATWLQVVHGKNSDKHVPCSPPMDCVKDIQSLPSWPDDSFLPLDLVTDVPVFDRRGVLIATPGYNRESAAWYEPAPGVDIPPIPDVPSDAELARAKSLILDELIPDFPFADESSRANAVGVMIQPFVRLMMAGPTPPHMFSASKAGAGKGKLIKALSIAAGGDGLHEQACVKDNDEWTKRILAILLDDPKYVMLDNINDHLDSGPLAAAFTAYPNFAGRILGQSKIVSLPVRCCWCLSANNPSVSSELARRLDLIRLTPNQEKPWKRKPDKYRHHDLIHWAMENRGSLVWAALVLVRHWIAAGRPRGRQSLGSYEAWAATMGGILEAAGIEGFLQNQDELYEFASDEASPWRAFVGEWWARHRDEVVGAAPLLVLCEEKGLLVDILEGPKTESGRKKRLGKELKKQASACYGDLRILHKGSDHRGTAQFCLVPVEEVIEA